MRTSCGLLVTALLSGFAFAAPPATAPAPVPLARPIPLAGFRRFGAGAQPADLGTMRVSDLVDISVLNGQLAVKWLGKEDLTGQFKVEGSPGLWLVRSGRSGAPLNMHTVIWTAENPPPEVFCGASLSILPGGRCSVSAAYSLTAPRHTGFLMVQPLPGAKGNELRLLITTGIAPPGRNILLAANLFELRDKYPYEMRQYVSAALVKLLGHDPIRPGAVEAYRRLTTIAPDPAMSAKVQTIIERFESRSPEDRGAAAKQLDTLGDAGVLAVIRLDPAALTPEQTGRVSEFLAARDHGAAYSGRADKSLLIDLLEMDDPAICAAAAKELGVAADASADQLRAAATQPSK